MKTIDLRGNIKEQFEKEGLAYPRLKYNHRWGLGNSTLLDRITEQESVKATIEYLKEHNIITITI